MNYFSTSAKKLISNFFYNQYSLATRKLMHVPVKKKNTTKKPTNHKPKLKSNIKPLQKNNNYTTKKKTSRTVKLRGTGMFLAALNKKLKLHICARQEKMKRTPEALSIKHK